MTARIAVSGSIASDHLMRFPGRFVEQLLPDRLDTVSLSFLVDDLVVRRGGVAANIAFGLAQLGLRPTLVGAVGHDFDEYRAWLESHGVDCDSLWISADAHTARFVCTTDTQQCQIASFYPGAMAEAARVRLVDVVGRSGGIDLVLVGADDPAAMQLRVRECRELGLPFAADPSQQLARMSRDEAIEFIDGADYLLTNEYERGLLETRTGLSGAALAARVGLEITTLGANGVRLAGRDLDPMVVPAAKPVRVTDPTGVGDAFRAGFFAALAWGLTVPRAAEVGCLLAVHVLETEGPQEYTVEPARFCERLAECYGDTAAAEVHTAWRASLPVPAK
jgi:adenosine kinase